ncbi:MAG: hypothetical protein IE938_19305 [Pseudomonas balearica]|jgi:hypothetical protein|nr:hypothetical protein [Stutzerimonas balearica]
MNDYLKTLSKHRRLAILRHLAEIPEYTGNASILQDVLAGLGLSSSRAQIITDLSWLRENGFVEFDPVAEFVVVAATSRGIEIARGLATHPEIQRPSPKV